MAPSGSSGTRAPTGGWLAGGNSREPGHTLAAALDAAAAEVEAAAGGSVEVVAVGDCPLRERGGAVVAAAREAMLNAAKFAGEAPISVYAELSGEIPAAQVDPELDLLTPREREVLQHIARGYMYKEIAAQLGISAKTVEAHVSAVLRKLQLSSRHELSRWAAHRRLVEE